jgi:hypothetical protein
MKHSLSMSIRTRILLTASIPFLCFYILGETAFGQMILQGKIPAGANHTTLDDIVMGAGLAPAVFGLTPFLLLGLTGYISWLIDWRKVRPKNMN